MSFFFFPFTIICYIQIAHHAIMKCLVKMSALTKSLRLLSFQELPDNQQERDQQLRPLQFSSARFLHLRSLREGAEPPGGLRVLHGDGLLQSEACPAGSGGRGGAGSERRKTRGDGGERTDVACGKQPDRLRRAGAGGRPGGQATGPAGRPRVRTGARRLQELHGQT